MANASVSDGRTHRRWAQVYRDELLACSQSCGTTEALVWVALLTYAHSMTGAAFPLQCTLSEGLGVSKRTVRRCLYELEDRGWVTRRWKPTATGKRREYLVCVGR